VLWVSGTEAQDIWELGGKFGVSNYQGDLVREHINVLESNFSWSLMARYNYDKGWSLRGEASFIKISADDRNYSAVEDPFRYNRALRMENNMMVMSGMIEFYPFWRYCPYFRPRFASVTRVHPYLGLGLSLLFTDLEFEDQNPFNGEQIPVNDGIAPAIPIEVGVKYFMHPDFNIGVSLLMNRSFSDRLDGYEFTEDEDWYIFTGFVLTTRIY
jgi:hypothetical protein